jgi:hypothetical protein
MKIILSVALVVLAADGPMPAIEAPRGGPYVVTCSIAKYCLWSDGEWRPTPPATTQPRARRRSAD